jgi:CDP-diacylglycerol--glycerol-3-phosphate 3-phosphatidyltransferase
MNWANRLTLGRLLLTVLFVCALTSTWSYGRTLALVLFVLAGISDYLDGEIARRYQIVTKFGKLMDPLVDKVMMAAAFICLVPLGAVPAWVATIVVARDFLITGLRCWRPRKGWCCQRRSWANTKLRGKSRRSFSSSVCCRRELKLAASAAAGGRGVELRGERSALDHDWPNDLLRAGFISGGTGG